MKKVFKRDYGRQLGKDVADWIEEQTSAEDGGVKVYKPTVVVELFDQEGNSLSNNE